MSTPRVSRVLVRVARGRMGALSGKHYTQSHFAGGSWGARVQDGGVKGVGGLGRELARCARRVGQVRGYAGEHERGPSRKYSFTDIQKLSSSPQPRTHIIDVRTPLEVQQTGRIPTSLNISITTHPDAFSISEEEFEDRFGFERPAKGDACVFYCKAGVRSRAAAEIARGNGWERVGEFEGSWIEWSEKGGQVEK
ncbi:hypothetical protein DSL72_005601 [Monilinia vaccinii-corymbosi]|uniref:Sulfurtransferase n=1 Tax=Monilinia vaccinii-corymbosi TaxID=61207 RepID=A0A8A3PG66_9HELO|nr:hypothetical protein DSL72_005601 [Monilinia vaccinii-corymbosi]